MYASRKSTWPNNTTLQGERQHTAYMSETTPELDGLRELDPHTLSAIHKRYFPEIFRYARYRLSNESVAEDIAGEAFMRLLESVNSGRGPHTNLRGWLMSTASNLVNDHLRNHYSHPTEKLTEDLNLHAEDPSPTQHVEHMDRNQLLHQALVKLTLEQQQVIAYRFGNSYSLKETAALMEKNVNAIKSLQFRAIAALKRSIGDELL